MRLTDGGRRGHDNEVASRRLLALLVPDGLARDVVLASEAAATSGRPAPSASSASGRGVVSTGAVSGASARSESAVRPPVTSTDAAPAAAPSNAASAGDAPASVLRPSHGDPEPRPAASAGGSSPRPSLSSLLVKWSPSWVDRMDVGPPGARALVVAGVVASLVAGCFVWMSRPRPEPVQVSGVHPSSAAPAAVSSPRSSVVVHVVGKVRRPGVVTLPGGARVIDAIKAAGGLRSGARTGALNLARRVVDGEQIAVGVRGAPAPAAPVAPGGGSAPGTQLDLNTATAEQFDRLPGIGPVLARRIVDYRDQHGGFRSVDQLQEVTGIGAAKFADIKDLVRV